VEEPYADDADDAEDDDDADDVEVGVKHQA
jgi:hypothetical protein